MQTFTAPYLRTIKQSSQVWSSLAPNYTNCSVCHIWCHFQTFLKISWISAHRFFCNDANRHELPLKKKNRKKNCIQGVKHNTPRCFRLFHVSSLTYHENLMKMCAYVFPLCCRQSDQQTDRLSNWPTDRRLTDQPTNRDLKHSLRRLAEAIKRIICK